MTETPRGTGHTNTNRRNWETGGRALDDDVVGGQQTQSPEEGIPEGGSIPLHRDTTRTTSTHCPLRRDPEHISSFFFCSFFVGIFPAMNEARLSHLPFWGPSEAIFFLIKRPSGKPE